jgi:hypothetical protein
MVFSIELVVLMVIDLDQLIFLSKTATYRARMHAFPSCMFAVSPWCLTHPHHFLPPTKHICL